MIDKFARYVQYEDIVTPVLNSEVLDSINEIKTNFFQGDRLRHFGISPFSKILFSGQSGCGKNLVAGYLAKEMKLKFFQTKPEAFLGDPKQIFENLRTILPTFRTSFCSTKRYMNYHQNLSQ